MSGNLEILRQKRGRDATHRASNLDTHLTHGCIQLFRHFRSKRLAFALRGLVRDAGFQPFFAQANRIRIGGAS